MNMKTTGRALVALVAATVLGGCSILGALVPISGINLAKTSDTIAVGSSDTLRYTLSPSFAADPGLVWTSSAPTVASVSSGGLVTGLATGTATITASVSGGDASAVCSITVVPVLYAVGSTSGNIYEINPLSGAASTTPLVSTTFNATGEVTIFSGKGFVAVGVPFSGKAGPGLYDFDPAKPAAGCTLVGTSISAQYLAVASATSGYVTSANYGVTTPGANALYAFNPSNLASGLVKVADLVYPQEVIQGGDGKIYVADNGSGKVARFNANALETQITCTVAGATGLLAGTYQGQPGVFVANTGNYTTGSLDFIADSGTTATAVVTGPVLYRVAALSSTLLVATGGYPARTWFVDLGAATIAPAEVKSGTASFGGSDIAIVGGKAYVPDGNNTVYVFGADGVVKSIAVGTGGELITNVGVAR